MDSSILVVNAGSSSIKFMLFEHAEGHLARRMRGQVEGIGTRLRLVAFEAADEPVVEHSGKEEAGAGSDAAIQLLAGWMREYLSGAFPGAVGHRVVHGGSRFDQPVLIDDDVLAELEDLVPLAPLHQPLNLAPIKAMRQSRPQTPQVACFDSAFHRGHDEITQRFALPDWLWQDGVRRYGFHGLSYEYIARALRDLAPEIADGRVVVAHLGSGASLCALKGGASVESSMGFTALDGLPMGTRPGRLDPGVLLYLINQKGMDGHELERLLYHECGLKGLSGISNDVRDLLASDDPGASLALEYFCHRTAAEIGAMAVGLGGLDGLVFTAGIGENVPEIRKGICDRLGVFGIELDEDANARHARVISREGPCPPVMVIATDEERMIAEHTLRVVGSV